jgi:hypothetical protein
MANKILQINLRFNVSAADLEKEFSTAASHIAGVPGLKWKIFGMNEERSEGAGLYLFEDDDSLKSYVEGPIVAGLKANKAFSDITLKYFDVVEKATAVTRGPIKATMTT